MKVTDDSQVIVFPGDWVKHQGKWFQVVDTGMGDNIYLDEGFCIFADAENLEEILSDDEYHKKIITA